MSVLQVRFKIIKYFFCSLFVPLLIEAIYLNNYHQATNKVLRGLPTLSNQ